MAAQAAQRALEALAASAPRGCYRAASGSPRSAAAADSDCGTGVRAGGRGRASLVPARCQSAPAVVPRPARSRSPERPPARLASKDLAHERPQPQFQGQRRDPDPEPSAMRDGKNRGTSRSSGDRGRVPEAAALPRGRSQVQKNTGGMPGEDSPGRAAARWAAAQRSSDGCTAGKDSHREWPQGLGGCSSAQEFLKSLVGDRHGVPATPKTPAPQPTVAEPLGVRGVRGSSEERRCGGQEHRPSHDERGPGRGESQPIRAGSARGAASKPGQGFRGQQQHASASTVGDGADHRSHSRVSADVRTPLLRERGACGRPEAAARVGSAAPAEQPARSPDRGCEEAAATDAPSRRRRRSKSPANEREADEKQRRRRSCSESPIRQREEAAPADECPRRRRRSKSPMNPREEEARRARYASSQAGGADNHRDRSKEDHSGGRHHSAPPAERDTASDRKRKAESAQPGHSTDMSVKEGRVASSSRAAPGAAAGSDSQFVGSYVELLKKWNGLIAGQRLKVVGEVRVSLKLEGGKQVPKSQEGKSWRWLQGGEAPEARAGSSEGGRGSHDSHSSSADIEAAQPAASTPAAPQRERAAVLRVEGEGARRLVELTMKLLDEWEALPKLRQGPAFSEVAQCFRARVPAETLAVMVEKSAGAGSAASRTPKGTHSAQSCDHSAAASATPAAAPATPAATSRGAGGRGCSSHYGRGGRTPGAGEGVPARSCVDLRPAAARGAAKTPPPRSRSPGWKAGDQAATRGRSPSPGPEAAAAMVAAAAAAAAKEAVLPSRRPGTQRITAEAIARAPTPGRAGCRGVACPGTPAPATPVVATVGAVRERSRSRRSPIAGPHVPMVRFGELVGQAR